MHVEKYLSLNLCTDKNKIGIVNYNLFTYIDK